MSYSCSAWGREGCRLLLQRSMKRKKDLVLRYMGGQEEGRGELSPRARKKVEEEKLKKETSRKCGEPRFRILVLEPSGSLFQIKEE